jgi:hypothetical protein
VLFRESEEHNSSILTGKFGRLKKRGRSLFLEIKNYTPRYAKIAS